MKKQFTQILLAAILFPLLFSCSPATRITGSWIDPAAKGQVNANKSVFIASLTRNIKVRTGLENGFAEQATQRNIKAIKSSDHFSPDFYQRIPSEKELISRIQETGADAILTVSLIDKKSRTRYVPGGMDYAPYPSFGWYGGFYSYFNYWRPMIFDPGYYVREKIYFLETNLYDVKTEKLIWSAQSETVDPGSIDNFVRDYPKVLIDQMVKDGLLQK